MRGFAPFSLALRRSVRVTDKACRATSDPRIKAAVYKGNSKSFVLVNIDITTHCGRFDMGASKVFFASSTMTFRD